jgi:hypothetical protein
LIYRKEAYTSFSVVVPGTEVYKITEETTITLKVNPAKRSFYIMPQAKDGQYPIHVAFEPIKFDIFDTSRDGVSSGCGEIVSILFTIVGSMYDDSANY